MSPTPWLVAVLAVFVLAGCDPHGTDTPSTVVVPGAGHGGGTIDPTPPIVLMGTSFDPDDCRDLFADLAVPSSQNWGLNDNGALSNLGTLEFSNDTQRGVPCVKRVRDFGLLDDTSWLARDVAGRLIEIRYVNGATILEPADYRVSEYQLPPADLVLNAAWADGYAAYIVVAVGAVAPNNGATDCVVFRVADGGPIYFQYWSVSEGLVATADDLVAPEVATYRLNDPG